MILLGFDGFFLRFHEVFFSGDTWRFSDTDTLLRIYPETFWQDTAKLAAAIVVAQAVVVGLAAGWWVRRIRPVGATPGGRIVIDLHRPPGGVLRIGHRGAATLAPENTLRSFRAAVEVGVDLIEFDVLDLQRGPLVLAHSDHLEEVSHGAARGRVRSLTLEQLREVAPELPTLDEALAFFVDEAPDVGLHVDLKLRMRLDELAAAIVRHGLEARTVVSGVHIADLLAVGRAAPKVRIGITYPEDKLSISRKPYLWPIVSLGLTSMRASVPMRVPRLARLARSERGDAPAPARDAPRRSSASHAAGLPVWAWTVDEPADLDRVVAAGVDGVITNDPRIFVGYTEEVNRGVTIAALSSCGAAGVIVALLLATAPVQARTTARRRGTTDDGADDDRGHDDDPDDDDDARRHRSRRSSSPA